jgi:pimeloyl-ACP methyl ester carboxylesterase
MRGSRIALAAAGAGAAAAGAAWVATRELDRRHIRDDPEYARIFAPLEGRVLSVVAPDGTRLHAEIFGLDGAPTLVLTHGWTCALRFWTYQIQALSPELRVVAWDLRGHGRSEAPPSGDYSIDTFGEDLHAVLGATVPEGERAVLAGHSMGGMTIVAWAHRHSDEVRRRAAACALVSTGMGDLMSEALVVRTPDRFKPVSTAIAARIFSSPLPIPPGVAPLALRAMRYLALSPAATPAQVHFCERMVIDCPARVRAHSAATLSHLDLYDGVKSLTAPTLVMVGERDKLTPPWHARKLEEELPEPTELVEVPRYGHMLPLEAHAEVTAALRQLVAASSSSSSTATASAGSAGNGASPRSASRSSA